MVRFREPRKAIMLACFAAPTGDNCPFRYSGDCYQEWINAQRNAVDRSRKGDLQRKARYVSVPHTFHARRLGFFTVGYSSGVYATVITRLNILNEGKEAECYGWPAIGVNGDRRR